MNKIITKIGLIALLIMPLGLATTALADVLITTNPATVITSTDATLNGTNGSTAADGHSFWASLAPFSTASPSLPAGVYSTIDLGAIGAGIPFSASLSSVSGLPSVTPSTPYYFAAWSNVGGTWYPGDVLSFTTAPPVLLGTLSAEDFGVVNYDAGGGLGILKGYTAGFGLTDATLASTTSVVVKLYAAGDVLLQTNTAIMPAFSNLPGVQFSSPFDVSGTFAYATDGYWTNVREAQYGQSVPAVKVVATVTLANGKVVTAENTVLTGDAPSTIYPVLANVTTNPATLVTSTSATLNGTNGPVNADNTSFWWGTTSAGPFTAMADPSSEFPVGWTHDAGLGSALATGTFNEPLTGLTPGMTYYFVAWSQVGGVWYPGMVLSFLTTTPTPTTGTISGMKYNDLNRNGKKGINEPGLAGWVIRLMSGNTVVATTTTDASGNYSFTNIVPGTYKVREVHQNGWKRMSKNPKAIVITAGSMVVGVDFGNTQKQKYEKEDTNNDDNRDDQSGNYYADHGRSNYENDQNDKDHQQKDDDHNGNNFNH